MIIVIAVCNVSSGISEPNRIIVIAVCNVSSGISESNNMNIVIVVCNVSNDIKLRLFIKDNGKPNRPFRSTIILRIFGEAPDNSYARSCLTVKILSQPIFIPYLENLEKCT